MNGTEEWNPLQEEGEGSMERTTGWNPWTVILWFAFLQIAILAIEWYCFGVHMLAASR
jgi:hypothetical protein